MRRRRLVVAVVVAALLLAPLAVWASDRFVDQMTAEAGTFRQRGVRNLAPAAPF